jgi:uncharacterized protein DUF402
VTDGGRWTPGETVLWRELWRGREYVSLPVRVVEDGPERVAVYLAEGTPFAFVPGAWPWGEHPWEAIGSWRGHGVLLVHNWGEANAVWHFWEGEERRFAGWYVNLQAPFRRRGRSFETQDHELDLVVEPDGTWRWKDEEELRQWVERGRFTAEEAAAIRAEGERVLDLAPWPTGWEDWQPDPSWRIPEPPPG